MEDKIRDILDFDDNRVYIMMAIARKNENEQLTHNTEVVFREVIRSEKDIRRKEESLLNKASGYVPDEGGSLRFRLYLTINARNTLNTYWNFRETMNGWARDLINGDDSVMRKFKKIDSHWKSELQRPASRDEKRFLFDVDDCTREEMERLRANVSDHTEVLATQETPNGFHVVTEPFNYNELSADVDYELKSDGMLFLSYIKQ